MITHIVTNTEETRMNNFKVAALVGFVTLLGASTVAMASEQECQKLKY